jgi:heterotetrameric sarcosine oxidase delta subunit
MLLINCPYCGERPEPEFVYGGQAHLARPAQPADLGAQDWADFLYLRDNTRGVHAERWRHAHGAGASSTRCATPPRTSSSPPTKSARRASVQPMNAALRTAAGGCIDRSRVLQFRFDGRSYRGLAGDTLASALLANGVHLLGRSFSHRPRGVLAAGAEEPMHL